MTTFALLWTNSRLREHNRVLVKEARTLIQKSALQMASAQQPFGQYSASSETVFPEYGAAEDD